MENRRIAITGLGIVSSVGLGEKEFLQNLSDQVSGIKDISYFKQKGYEIGVGAQAKDCTALIPSGLKKYPKPFKNLYASSSMALEKSGILDAIKPHEIGCYVAGPGCSVEESENFLRDYLNKGLQNTSLFDLAFATMDSMVNELCYRFKIGGPRNTILTACSSSTLAIGMGIDLIKQGEVKAMLVGGADGFSELTYAGFSSLQNISPTPCSPFDQNRQGLSFGEGSGLLVLEDMEHAKKRGAPIYAELLSYGAFGEGQNLTAPSEEGTGYIVSMRQALQEAKINPEKIDYINAHGTATILNDKTEAVAVSNVFKNAGPVVSSIKGSIGHCMGAAGALEACASILSIKHNRIFGTTNLKSTDASFKVDIAKDTRESKIKYVLSNSAGFGGNNASLLFGAI